jgi:membrane protein
MHGGFARALSVLRTARDREMTRRSAFVSVDTQNERAMSGSMPSPSDFSVMINPGHWLMATQRVGFRSLGRLWGRNVMLYTGGVSFFALLAAFPAVAILIGVYSLLLTPAAAITQADALAQLMPPGPHALFQSELLRLARAPIRIVSAQSGAALLIALYASHRGFKALIAGLSFIHGEDEPRSFWGFNLLAFGVLVAAFALMGILSAVFVIVRVLGASLFLAPLTGLPWFFSQWTWVTIGLGLGLTLIYRYAMSSHPVGWRASIAGGVAAALLSVVASWASAIYVKEFSHFGAMYGSIAAVVVMLVWLSWNVNAIFYGGALATEMELSLDGEKPLTATEPVRLHSTSAR